MYPGVDGFLGTRASLMLDVVFLAMFAVLPVMGFSIWLVRYQRRFLWHKRIQLTLASVLGLTVLVFEVDMRLHGWRERAAASPYYAAMSPSRPLEQFVARCASILGFEQPPGWVWLSLWVHLVFAVTTAALWIWVVGGALWRFESPPEPGPHSRRHKLWGWLAAIDLTLTSLTGWIFYYLAFVA